ncbi:MAG: hypothetical protein ACOX44_03405 [Limnochordia bacterium]|jgi:hypothetical protein|nr:hypothetical protein [Clostridiales bacterium]
MKRILTLVLIALFVMFGTSTLYAADPIPGWSVIRDDMEIAKGALKQVVGSTVLNTYIPDYGVVFMFTVEYGLSLDQVQVNLEKVLRYLVPTIDQLKDGERIALVGYYESFLSEWEIMYIATKESSSDPKTWHVYLNEKK